MRERAGSRDIVQRLLARLYDRIGARIVLWMLVPTTLGGLGTLAVAAVWADRYLHLSPGKAWGAAGVAAPIAVTLWLGVMWLARDRFRRVLAWAVEERSPELAGQVWTATIWLPSHLMRRASAAVVIGGVPAMLLIKGVIGLSLAQSADLYCAGMLSMGALTVPVLFGCELALRPLLADVARFLPPDFEPAGRAWTLRTKALAALPAVTLFSAFTVGAFADISVSGPLRMLIVAGIADGIVVAAGAIFWLVMRSLLEPIDELLSATGRVGRGDIDTPVPVVTDDELGSLAAGFNRMLADLRRHERELQDSRARVVAAADAARRRVERDLHDGAQQQLVLVGLKLGAARRLVDSDPARAGAALDELKGDLDRALTELRDLAHGLYPALLESEGLPAALRDAATRSAVPTSVESDGAGRYPAEVEAAVYFCCLEALQNASKHAGADARATVKLAQKPGALTFEVADDGAGFNVNGRAAGAGLENMADRVAALGGELHVRSCPGAGTTIAGTIPLT